MSRTGLLAALLIACFVPASLAQAPDKAAIRAKKDACQAEAKAKNIADKTQRKTFINDCMARK